MTNPHKETVSVIQRGGKSYLHRQDAIESASHACYNASCVSDWTDWRWVDPLQIWVERSSQAYRGSVKAFVHFNAKQDADTLRKAMKGVGTDEDTILMLLTARNNDQRQEIKAAFKKAHGKDLVKDLKSELGGKLEDLIIPLMSAPRVYDADQLHKAIKGAGTNDKVLIEILASRTPEQKKEINKIYKKEYGGKLEKDIMGDTSGHYQRLLVMLAQGEREEGVDESRVEKDAKELFAAGAKKVGTDEEKFVQILGNRSIEHLRQVFDVYKKIAGCDIEESICGEFTGNLEALLVAVVKCVKSVPGYFAYSLRDSMRRAGTDDETLIRIMVSRSEEDMLDIRAQYKKMYGESLHCTIQAGGH
ncbi:annexin A5 [Silurus asotus]|uniref:Annexin n=1 Tax=Silurus asotus TaxID=30991 RepID=A0AAD5AXP8_SILAS|nr:annexin A5 [Silurus asotus]